jgi:membrane-bound ClpP family serine protease
MLALVSVCPADTFRNPRTNEVLHGYATTQVTDGKTVVHTAEKGEVELNLAKWQITPDRLGRNNKVIVLTLDNNIMLQIQTEALVKAVARASDEGPLFVVLELDTPGGRTDYTRRICGAITEVNNCRVIAFVRGGKHGGAISAGAAVAFACDTIYVAPNAVVGAATAVTLSAGGTKGLKESYDTEVAEKISSAWRAYLASLAEQSNRPKLLAGAMVDKDLEVIEVSEADRRLFIDPVNKTPEQTIVHTWSKKGSLLTLTAEEAVQCGIADKVVNTRRELLRHLNAGNAEIVTDDSFQKAGKQFERAKQRFHRLSNSLDLKIKQWKQTQIPVRGMKLLRDIRKDYKTLIALAQRYPDLNVNVRALEAQLNFAEALYKEGKMRR